MDAFQGMRALLTGLLALLLGTPVGATWSIVVVNARTGEVGVASATCLEAFNLRRWTPVIVVGKGVASAQGQIDTTGDNRRFLRNSLRDEVLSPEGMIEALSELDFLHEARTYGIASFAHGAGNFQGLLATDAKLAVTGELGDYVYTVQGGALTSTQVILASEEAFRSTPGDMGQRLLAALQAGKRLGGDGRCSCPGQEPDACGAPPPHPAKSSHCGYLIVARHGDVQGSCATGGCATGNYHLNLNIAGVNSTQNSPDPVDQMQWRYDRWRERQIGRPDGVLSEVQAPPSLPANGRARRTLRILLRDIDRNPLLLGGATIEISSEREEPLVSVVGVVDHGNGTYSMTIQAGSTVGTDRLTLRVDDGLGAMSLHPPVEIDLTPSFDPFVQQLLNRWLAPMLRERGTGMRPEPPLPSTEGARL